MPTMTPPAGTEVRWLACRIDKGMFDDELAVTYPAEGERQKSVFVSNSAAQGQPGQTGKVRITLIRQNGTLFGVLPSSNQDIVTVREADLTT
ncbi:unnamed protein product [Gemmataceae bacterium]|nr:unnamed protein product [Gemmataceae bacterium]VTU00846.1 unnamed protein product [Gemmataceae bacterium]